MCCSQQVSLKVLTTRPELETNVEEEEVSVRLSVLPIRLNIDQVSLLHMCTYIMHVHVCIVFAYVHEQFYHQAFILQDSFYFLFEFFSNISDTSSLYCEYQTLAWDTGLHSNLSPDPPSPPATVAPPAPNPPTSTQAGQVFIRSFVFQPALPIKIDYTTKWRFPTDTMVSYG